METKTSKPGSGEALARHERKCTICHHPDREAIEEDFVSWIALWRIQKDYEIEDSRPIYRHARATGLVEIRRENARSALDRIVEQIGFSAPSTESILRAIRAYSCLDEYGRWTDLPTRVVYTAACPAHAGQSTPSASGNASQTTPIPSETGSQSAAPLPSPAPDRSPSGPPQAATCTPDPNSKSQILIGAPRLETTLSD